MRAKSMSAWLCAAACADVAVVAVEAGDEVASFVPELLHAPITATAATAASPAATVLVVFTNGSSRRLRVESLSSVPGLDRAVPAVL